MEARIKEYIEKYGYRFIKIKNKKSIRKIYDFYFNNVNQIKDICLSTCSELELLYYGVYSYINKNYCDTIDYCLVAIEKGNSAAMYLLGYYCEMQHDYKNMLEYYLMAIEKGNSYAMYRLGYYYETQHHDYETMIEYYLMAIENGNDQLLLN